MLKIGIVGCGKIADAHVEEITKLDSAKLVAVCDAEPLMAEQLAVRYGIKRHYSSPAEMLETEHPDVVHITTPPHTHLDLAHTALAAGCHIYVEKPVALDYAQTAELVCAVQGANRLLTVGYLYNFERPLQRLQTLLREGVLGDPVHIEAYYGYDLSGVYGSAFQSDHNHWVSRLPGGLFQNIIDHILSPLLLFITDNRPSVVAFGYSRSGAPGIDELRFMIRGSTTSACGVFSCNSKPTGPTLKLYCTHGTAYIDFVSRTLTVDSGVTLPSVIGRLARPFSIARQTFREGCRNLRAFRESEYHYFGHLGALLSAFYTSILTQASPPIEYRDILRAASIMDAIVEQSTGGVNA